MRLPWQKAESEQQLDLLGDSLAHQRPSPRATLKVPQQSASGTPRMVPTTQVAEDPANPRTEFPDDKVSELANDIRQRGILEAIVVHPVNEQGKYVIHFGAMRLRAAVVAGLSEVPVVIRDAPADRYAQVAENLKRHSLSPFDLARFMRSRVDAGESNAAVADKLGMDLTSVAHHLALLELPPVLNDAMKSGRCTSPRTLFELRKLHATKPEAVEAAVAGASPLTRAAVNALRTNAAAGSSQDGTEVHRRSASLLDQAESLCARLEKAVQAVAAGEPANASRLAALRMRLAHLVEACSPGSDSPTCPNGGVDGLC
jgi:ParB family transcriptional regulator, chromosome partitioning protein